MNALLQTAVFVAAMGQPDPGTIAVVDGDQAIVTFTLPANTQYQLDYPIGQSLAWFDAARTNLANTFTTYSARSKGDLDGDGILDARDIQNFVTRVISGLYDSRADFNDDSVLDSDDVPGMVEALLGGYPANGVVLFVDAQSPSSQLGDAPINLLAFVNGNWVQTQSTPMTLVQFQLPTNGAAGTPAQVIMSPAIAPLAFSSATTARWQGEALVNSGTAPAFTVEFDANQVRERSDDTADLIVGDGLFTGQFPQEALFTSTGITRGRVTFQFGGLSVTTPAFNFDHINPVQSRRNILEFDEHDPGAYEPAYGMSADDWMVLHVADPTNPKLDTLWAYQFALEAPLNENADSSALAPTTITVDVFSFDAGGNQVDLLANVVLARDDNDGDPSLINYRSSLALPMIFVDQTVNKADFPNLQILIITDGGSTAIRRQ